MHTGKLEQYKRLIRFGFNILLLAILIFFFIHIGMKKPVTINYFPFYYKGYLMMAAFYAFFFTVFSYILGGMKIGYLKSSSLMLSQTLFPAVGIKCADLFGDSSFVGEIHSC